MSGWPMLPPRMTGWAASAARIAAVSDEVVVLPFVPVTPTVGTGHRRRKRSASDTSAGTVRSPPARASTNARNAARRPGSVVGKSGVIDGEVATSAASAQVVAGSTSGPSISRTARSPSAAIASASSPAGRPS